MNPITPIKRRKLSDEVLERLLELFESGEIRPDDEMPSERELMERFQVGRPAVREALQSLERMGLIKIRHGGRAKVIKPTEDGIFDQIDFTARQLLAGSDQNVEFLQEARQVLETGIARLAVSKASPAEIETLKKHLDAMRRNMSRPDKFLKADQEFHLTLAGMTKNPILWTAMRAVFKWLARHRADLLGVTGLEYLTVEEHEAILKNMIDRNAEGVVKEISDHIMRLNELYHNTHNS